MRNSRPNRPKIRHSSSRPSIGRKARGLARSAGVLMAQEKARGLARSAGVLMAQEKARGLARSAGVLMAQDTATVTAASSTLTSPEAVSCTSEDTKAVARERPDF